MLAGLALERDQLQELGAAGIDLGRRERASRPRIDGVEQRHAQVLGDG